MWKLTQAMLSGWSLEADHIFILRRTACIIASTTCIGFYRVSFFCEWEKLMNQSRAFGSKQGTRVRRRFRIRVDRGPTRIA